MKKLISMREALSDDRLLGTVLPGPTWRSWRIILTGIMGEALHDDELETWSTLTGREVSPTQPVEELWAVVGRRGGKTRAAAALSAYLASLCSWRDALVPGEIGKLTYLAATQKQAFVAMSYASAIYTDIPAFRQKLLAQSVDSLSLKGGVELEVRAASFRNLRGITSIGIVADEIAFWSVDEGAANPDTEILNAIRPSLATTGGPLIAISSPFARRGELFAAWEAHHGTPPGHDPRIVVVHGGSRTLNPSLPAEVVSRAISRDPARARAEWLAQWRDDVEGFVTLDAVRACVDEGVTVRPWQHGYDYVAFVDPSGGSSDAMTLGIAHREGDIAILDRLEVITPPFDPELVVESLVKQMDDYGIRSVSGDRYGAVWVQSAFERRGVRYRPSKLSRTELYLALLPAINSQTARLLDDERLVSQLVGLERRVSRTGRESVDHRQGQHDDIANAAAGALVEAAEEDDTPSTIFMTRDGTVLGALGGSFPVGGSQQKTIRTSSLFSGLDYNRSKGRL